MLTGTAGIAGAGGAAEPARLGRLAPSRGIKGELAEQLYVGKIGIRLRRQAHACAGFCLGCLRERNVIRLRLAAIGNQEGHGQDTVTQRSVHNSPTGAITRFQPVLCVCKSDTVYIAR